MTGQDSSRRPWTVTDPLAAAFLSDPVRRRYFLPFLGRIATVSQAAAELRIETNAMLYRVQQMLGLGLLCEDHLKPRAGRAVRHYRSISSLCFVPFAATPFETHRAQVKRNEFAQHQVFAAAWSAVRHSQMSRDGWGALLERDSIGSITVTPARLDSTSAVSVQPSEFLSTWSELYLSADHARDLEARLRELMAEFTQHPSEAGGGRYLLHVGFVPLEPLSDDKAKSSEQSGLALPKNG